MRIEQSLNTPEIYLDEENDYILFQGESKPENVRDFYEPVMTWFAEYNTILQGRSGKTLIECEFKLSYFNSSSAKYILDVFEKLEELEEAHAKVKVHVKWYHDPMDEDMIEAGHEFEHLTSLKLDYIQANL